MNTKILILKDFIFNKKLLLINIINIFDIMKIVKYKGELYSITRIKDDKVNLAHPNGGKVIHKDIPIQDLYVAGGTKERKLKGYRP